MRKIDSRMKYSLIAIFIIIILICVAYSYFVYGEILAIAISIFIAFNTLFFVGFYIYKKYFQKTPFHRQEKFIIGTFFCFVNAGVFIGYFVYNVFGETVMGVSLMFYFFACLGFYALILFQDPFFKGTDNRRKTRERGYDVHNTTDVHVYVHGEKPRRKEFNPMNFDVPDFPKNKAVERYSRNLNKGFNLDGMFDFNKKKRRR